MRFSSAQDQQKKRGCAFLLPRWGKIECTGVTRKKLFTTKTLCETKRMKALKYRPTAARPTIGKNTHECTII